MTYGLCVYEVSSNYFHMLKSYAVDIPTSKWTYVWRVQHLMHPSTLWRQGWGV